MPTGQPSVIEVAFELSRDDYWAFNRFCTHRLARRWLRIPLTLLAVLVGLNIALWALLSWLSSDADPVPPKLISELSPIPGVVLLTLLFAGVLALFLSKRLIRRLPNEGGGTLGAHRLRLTPEGVHDETATGHSFNAWSGILETAEDDGRVYLFLDRMVAHVVPKRAFASGALEGFLAYCRSHQRSDGSPARKLS